MVIWRYPESTPVATLLIHRRWAIRLVLGTVGIGSLGLLAAILAVRPVSAPGARRIALVGITAFCLQTAVMDALVWPAFFPV